MKSPLVTLQSWPLSIGGIQESDRKGWEHCWDRYTEGETTPEITEATWNRLNDLTSPSIVYGLIAKTDLSVLGILHARLDHGTFSLKPWLYVEDLFIDAGAQREMLRHLNGSDVSDIANLFKFSVAEIIRRLKLDVSGIEFDTDEENLVARRVYEKRIGVGKWEQSQKRVYRMEKGNIQEEFDILDNMVSNGKILIPSRSE